MQPINLITIVLRAKEGETLAPLLQHVTLGSPVAIGTGVAIIAGASDRDVLEAGLGSDEICIDARIREVASQVDPRNLFVRLNPIGASHDELEQGRSGFVDERTHADYLIFLAGYRAALEASQ
ncbi:carbon storage regulator [Pseudomonas abietaniphila]|uniref:carbon storage regulator n=1 Tax=Pseudomonas abietaniphila TaxID=89065 RepID=UPI000B08E50F|nr:carbon storage regulator [Pseudomonas abietaniphila]